MDEGEDIRLGSGDKTLCIVGAVIGAVPFMASSTESSSTTVNGKVTESHHRDNIAIGGGALAVMIGVVALFIAIRHRVGSARIAAACAVLLLGAYQLARGFGAL